MLIEMQLHRLEGFHWVARTGGYARAARAFPYPITQPAVHQQIRKLESDLGVVLFERVAKDRVILTPAGRRLHEFIAPFFDQLPSVVRSVRSGPEGGELHILAPALLLRALLPAWVHRLRRRIPNLEVQVREVAAADVEPLRRGEADLLVQHLPEVPPDVNAKRIATLRGYVIVPKDHRLASRKRVSLKDLADETFISYDPALLAHDLQMRALREHGVDPVRTITASTYDTIVAFVEAGLGVSAVAVVESAAPRGRGIVALPIAAPKFELPVYAAWRKSLPDNPVLAAALETAPVVR